MAPTSQIGFLGPDGMQVRWDVSARGGFDSEPLVALRAATTFRRGRSIASRSPTSRAARGSSSTRRSRWPRSTPRTAAFLAHNAVPFQLTEEDLDQVTSGNFVTKVVYLPDPDYQELAVAGVETLVSTRLDPGCRSRSSRPIAAARSSPSSASATRISSRRAVERCSGVPVRLAAAAAAGAGGGDCPSASPLRWACPVGGNPSQLPPPSSPASTAPAVRHADHRHADRPARARATSRSASRPACRSTRSRTTRRCTFRRRPGSSGCTCSSTPGLSYPKPARHAYVSERARRAAHPAQAAARGPQAVGRQRRGIPTRSRRCPDAARTRCGGRRPALPSGADR